jgi:hypothetical protein
LAAAVVNAVFSESPSNETGRRFIQNEDNLGNVRLVIEQGIKPQEKLRQIITDAVRVKCALELAMNTNLSEPDFIRLCREPIDNLKRLGLLIPGGDMPVLSIFLNNAGTFIQACKFDLDSHRSPDLIDTSDGEDRILCPDGSCIGVITRAGICSECKRTPQEISIGIETEE